MNAFPPTVADFLKKHWHGVVEQPCVEDGTFFNELLPTLQRYVAWNDAPILGLYDMRDGQSKHWHTILHDLETAGDPLDLAWIWERGDVKNDHVFLTIIHRFSAFGTTYLTFTNLAGGVRLPPFPEIPNTEIDMEYVDVSFTLTQQQLQANNKQRQDGFCAYWTAWFTIFVTLCSRADCDFEPLLQRLADTKSGAYHLIQGFACDFQRDFYEEAREEETYVTPTWLRDHARIMYRDRFYAFGDKLPPDGLPVQMEDLNKRGVVLKRRNTMQLKRDGRLVSPLPLIDDAELHSPKLGDVVIQTGRPSDVSDTIFHKARTTAKRITGRGASSPAPRASRSASRRGSSAKVVKTMTRRRYR